MPSSDKKPVVERHIGAAKSSGHGHSHDGAGDACFGLCKTTACGLTRGEIIGAFALALPLSYWYRVAAVPWMQANGIFQALATQGVLPAISLAGKRLAATSGQGMDMSAWVSQLMIWISQNPWMLATYALLLLGVITGLDTVLQFFGCCSGHSHSHSHGHSHGGDDSDRAASAARKDKAAELTGRAPELKSRPSDDGADASEVARFAAKPRKGGVLTVQDTKGTVRQPGKRPFKAFHVADPVLLLKKLGRWPPPPASIIGGPEEAVQKAKEEAPAAEVPESKAAKSKSKVKRRRK